MQNLRGHQARIGRIVQGNVTIYFFRTPEPAIVQRRIFGTIVLILKRDRLSMGAFVLNYFEIAGMIVEVLG